jgi:1,4-dihydroxy-2-naphthoate octaprenyltransferase
MFQTKRMFLVLQKKKKTHSFLPATLKTQKSNKNNNNNSTDNYNNKNSKKKKMEIRIGVKKDYFVFVVLSLLLFFDFFLSFFVAYFPHFLLSLLSFSLIGSFNSFRHAAFINIIFGFNLLLKDNKQIKKEEE